MLAALHVLATLLLVPYAVLAFGFLVIGRVATQKTLWDALDAFLVSVNHALGWGIYVFGAALIAIALAGCVAATQLAAAIALAALSSAVLVVLIAWPTTLPDAGQWVFLAPCIAIVAFSLWRVVRLMAP